MHRIVNRNSRVIYILTIALILWGCGSKQDDNKQSVETETEKQTQDETFAKDNTDSTAVIKLEPETIPSELKEEITVATGTKEIKLEDVIMGYRHQDAEFVNPLSEEDLMKANTTYDLELSYKGKSYFIKVNVIDTQAPDITGVHDIYIYEGDSISYKKNIVVTDNSGEDIKLEIDNSKVDTGNAGTYPVYYQAVDSSGNKTIKGANVYVQVHPVIDEAYMMPYIDKVISSVVAADMSDWDKAYQLWNWCRRNIAYTHASGDRTSEWTGAYEGLVKKCGDCYTFYATYAVLLDRVGIENMQVARVGGTTNHWWNLVNIGDGWYHCDSSPRTIGDRYKCFMQTDEQIAEYTKNYTLEHPDHPNYYTFDESLYPERGTKVVYEN